jgi:threonine synthase
MSFVRGLACRECGADYPQQPVHVCEACFGPLEVRYDYDEQGRIGRDASIVVSMTGNGYKTVDAIAGETDQPFVISARLQEFDELHYGIVRSDRKRVVGA